MSFKYTRLKSNQQGVVSLIASILIILLLTLIVLAMSQNARNEQRQALDRQLSNQAFYNAESGINDVVNYLYNNPASADEKLTDCDTSLFGGGNLDASGVNKYTCVFYTKIPKTIELQNLGTSDSKTISLEPNDPAAKLGTLTFSWDDTGRDNTFSGCSFAGGSTPEFPQTLPGSCSIGGLRIDLVGMAGSRDGINNNNVNAFLMPGSGGTGKLTGGIPGYPDNQGIVGRARCSVPPVVDTDPDFGLRTCKFTIESLGVRKFELHIRALYKPVDVRINGTNLDGSVTKYKNAQIMVDSTGKANDVLRRVQERLPLKPETLNGEFALQSKDSICKLYEVDINSVTNSPSCP